MALTLLRTEHLGGTAFGLYFQIENDGGNNPVDGQIFDVHGLAQMKFFTQYVNDDKFNVLLSIMKHEFTMAVKIEMKLICEEPEFKFNLPCSETWSRHTTLFQMKSTKLFEFNVEVDIKVGSSKSTLDNMYIDEDFTDFQLCAKEGSVPVHQVCLAAHSDVFKRMLCGEWKETNAGSIEIQGVTLTTLQNLKRYMYLRTLPEEGLYPLLLIASFYLIDELKVACTIKLAHSITSENLYEALEFSCVNNIPELTFAILKTVRAQPATVIGAAEQRTVKPKQKEDVIENTQALVSKSNNNE